MAKLEYTFRRDTLFKMLFCKKPKLLKCLISQLLGIKLNRIRQFEILNTEIPPDIFGTKFCRFDIVMLINGQRVVLEVQDKNLGNYGERSLYYASREYSISLEEGQDYAKIPRVILINIINFSLFEVTKFYSEVQPLEVECHAPLTDKMTIGYYDLTKLPEKLDKRNLKLLWLCLFKADTDERLKEIKELGVEIMSEAVDTYYDIVSSKEFKELERLRLKAKNDEFLALNSSFNKGEKKGAKDERKKWQGVVAEKDALIEELKKQLAEKK